MIQDKIKFFRYVAIAEAVSYLILLGFAMPMKYFGGNEFYVKSVFGPGHGVLFVLFGIALIFATPKANWDIKTFFKLGFSSLVPILPFFIDPWLKKEEKRVLAEAASTKA